MVGAMNSAPCFPGGIAPLHQNAQTAGIAAFHEEILGNGIEFLLRDGGIGNLKSGLSLSSGAHLGIAVLGIAHHPRAKRQNQIGGTFLFRDGIGRIGRGVILHKTQLQGIIVRQPLCQIGADWNDKRPVFTCNQLIEGLLPQPAVPADRPCGRRMPRQTWTTETYPW